VAGIYGLIGLMGAVVGVPALAYLFGPRKTKATGGWTEVGDVGRLAPNVPEEMVFRRTRVDGWKVISEKTSAWVVRKSEKELVAFAPQCTHLGCAYHWNDGKNEFLCPCHTSTFSIEGQVLTGPAPRALDRYQVRMDGSKLLVGKIEKSA